MKIRESLAPIVAASLMFGCAGDRESDHAGPTSTARDEQIQPQPEIFSEEAYVEAMQESLNAYRNRVLLKHQARILLGACVAWENDSEGVAVTLNPGIGEATINGTKENYLVFSHHNPKYNPDWGPLNGPTIGSPEVMTLIFKPKIIPKGNINNRVLSPKELKDQTGQRYYVDTQTREPVMNTVLADGPFTVERVAEVCDNLRFHEPITSPAQQNQSA